MRFRLTPIPVKEFSQEQIPMRVEMRCRMVSSAGIMLWLLMGLAVAGARELLQESSSTIIDLSREDGGGVRTRPTPASSGDLGIDTSGGPVDVYLLADNTGSMSGEIADVRQNALSIFDRLSRKSSSVFWGVGSYRDTQDEFLFRNNLGVTELPPEGTPDNDHPILNAIKEWNARGGGDRPEGQLWALYIIATRQKNIGWRANSNKIVVWFGDAEAHDPLEAQGEVITEEKATRALQDAGIQVLSLDVGGLNDLGQAKRISAATNGRYNFIGRPQRAFPSRGFAVADGGSRVSSGGGAAASTAVSDAIVSGVSSLLVGGP